MDGGVEFYSTAGADEARDQSYLTIRMEGTIEK